MAAVIDHDGDDGAPLAVRCVGVEKSFAVGETAIHVLRGTDFFARAGEMTFLVGPSGCGKTTLISIIGAILSADAGTIEVLGTDIRRVRGEHITHRGMTGLNRGLFVVAWRYNAERHHSSNHSRGAASGNLDVTIEALKIAERSFRRCP